MVFKPNIFLSVLDFCKNEANGYSYDFYLEKILDKGTILVVAFYSGDYLTGLELIPFESEGVETELYGDIVNCYNADAWKAFVVSSMSDLIPLSNAVDDLIE